MIMNSLHFLLKSKAIALYLESHVVIMNSLHFLQKSKAIALYLESNFTDFELSSVPLKIKGYSLIY